MKRILNVTCLFLLFSIKSNCQEFSLESAKCYGGDGDDIAYSVSNTIDNGLILAGSSNSFNGDISNHPYQGDDFWIVKLDNQMNIEWEKTYGGSYEEIAYSIIQLTDSSYVAIGSSKSQDGDVSFHHGLNDYSDCWIIKLDKLGNLEWEKSLGGTQIDYGVKILQDENELVILGVSSSDDGDVSGHHGDSTNFDNWVIKLDLNGNFIWENSFGGSFYDYPGDIIKTDVGYAICASTGSNDGDVTNHFGLSGNSFLYSDVWVYLLNDNGSLLQQNSFGGSSPDEAYSIITNNSGGFYVCGNSKSTDGNITVNKGLSDGLILNLDGNLNLLSQKTFGGNLTEGFRGLIKGVNDDNNLLLLTGSTQSNSMDINNHYGVSDYWALLIDTNYNIISSRCYGGNENEFCYSSCKKNSNSIVLAGYTRSNNNDVSGLHGNSNLKDYWLVNLGFTSSITNPIYSNNILFPNPSLDFLKINTLNLSQNTKINILNSIGEVVLQLNYSNQDQIIIDTRTLNNGIYFLEYSTTTTLEKFKVVVNHN